MGAHTRLATLGKKEDNINNHPVNWNGCWVTHNGHINNHEVLRRLAREGGSIVEKEPVVDTAGISAIMSLVRNPKDEIDKIKEYLQKIEGGFAIHVVWSAHPGISLLARGNSSPLILRMTDGIVTYSSEPEASYMMMQAMGIEDPEGDNVTLRSLDTGHFILVEDGNPIYWSKFTPQSSYRWNNSNYEANKMGAHEITRVLPDREPLYISGKADLFGNNPRPWSSMVADQSVRKVYSVNDGIHAESYDDQQIVKHVFGTVMQNGQHPSKLAMSTTPLGAAFGEIGELYYHTPKGDDSNTTLYIWINNVELVTNKWGTVKEVYNWDNVYDRWEIKPLEVAPILPDTNFSDWLIKNSNPTKTTLEGEKPMAEWLKKYVSPPSENRRLPARAMDFYSEYEDWLTEDDEVATYIREKEAEASSLGRSYSNEVPDAYAHVISKRFNEWITASKAEVIDYCFMDTEVGVIPLISGKEWCMAHRTNLEYHDDPFNCKFMVKAGGCALMAVDCVTTLESIFNSDAWNHVEIKTNTQKAKKQSLCGTAGRVAEQHSWKSAAIQTVKYEDMEFFWPIMDECQNCHATKTMIELPKLIVELQGGEN